jgi:hypothetical protein
MYMDERDCLRVGAGDGRIDRPSRAEPRALRARRQLVRLVQVLIVAQGLIIGAAPALGQTRLAWPDTKVDVSKYTTIDECLAALGRVRETIGYAEARVLRRDTMPWDPRESLRPTPSPVVETAQRCGARFATVDSIPLKGFDFFLPLYLDAGWDDKAKALVDRRLSAVPPKANVERAAVIDTVVNLYLNDPRVMPIRIAAIKELLNGMAAQLSDRVGRMMIYDRLMQTELKLADTASAEKDATRIAAAADSLTAAERERLRESSKDSLQIERYIEYDARRLQRHQELLDSLRHSTAAYVALARRTWTQTTRMLSEAYGRGSPIGEHAPAIKGDFWFGRADSNSAYPRPGHVSLVVFLDDGSCMPAKDAGSFSESTGCWNVWATIRRLSKRFPALEITVVTQTHAYFQYAALPAPGEEAALMRQWMDAHGVSATLAVIKTPFWLLPDPDGRRIEQPSPNITHYSFGKSWPLLVGSAFLIDPDGIIVHTAYQQVLSRMTESEYTELIQVLLSRQPARG